MTALTAAAPLALGLARRALGDELNAPFLVVALGTTIELLHDRRRRGWAAVAALYTLAFVTRELNVQLVGIALALVAWRAVRTREWPGTWPVRCVSVVPLAAAALLLVVAAGGVAPLVGAESQAIAIVRAPENAYAFEHGDGPWFRFVVDFLVASPWPTLLYLVWLGTLLVEGADERLVAWALVPPLFVAGWVPFLPKLARYALALDVPLRLSTVLLLERIFAYVPRGRGALLAAALVVMITADLAAFHLFFVRDAIYDPSSALLLQARRFVPR